jgi:hypothetical protein
MIIVLAAALVLRLAFPPVVYAPERASEAVVEDAGGDR